MPDPSVTDTLNEGVTAAPGQCRSEPPVFMPYDLAGLRLSEMTRLGASLRAVSTGAQSMEQAAGRVVNLLYNELVDPAIDARACALVRFYLTMQYSSLDPGLQAFGARLMRGIELAPSTRCLTLLATAGEKQEWQTRHASAGHQTIPLPSVDVIQAIPMVSQLITQLGLSVGDIVTPDPALVLELEQRTYNVFFVPEAVGSPYIPAQETFVRPYKIRSVLGFGGLLPSGDVYSVLLFTRLSLSRATADMFRNAAMNLKLALLPLMGRPVLRESVLESESVLE